MRGPEKAAYRHNRSGEAGGQPGILYPEKEIYNWPAFQAVTGQDISKNFVQNALEKGCVIKQGETAVDMIDVPGGLRVQTDKGSYTAAAVIVAIGNGFLSPSSWTCRAQRSSRARASTT